MTTYVYYIAERIAGAQEMQRFAHPIHVGIVSATDHEAAYSVVLEDLRPTFADAPQHLDIERAFVEPFGQAACGDHRPIADTLTHSAAPRPD